MTKIWVREGETFTLNELECVGLVSEAKDFSNLKAPKIYEGCRCYILGQKPMNKNFAQSLLHIKNKTILILIIIMYNLNAIKPPYDLLLSYHHLGCQSASHKEFRRWLWSYFQSKGWKAAQENV